MQPGTNGFYFVRHLISAGSDAPSLEVEPNNTFATADALIARRNPDGSYTFSIEGDLNPAGTDIDFHKVPPSGVTRVTGSCNSRRLGSSVLLAYALVDSNNTTDFEVEESPPIDRSDASTIPAGGLALRVRAIAQVAGITDTSYVCNFFGFSP